MKLKVLKLALLAAVAAGSALCAPDMPESAPASSQGQEKVLLSRTMPPKGPKPDDPRKPRNEDNGPVTLSPAV